MSTDADLEALPAPRRPFRRLTLAVMGVTLLASLALTLSLRNEVAFSLSSAAPRPIGELASFRPGGGDANTWVQAEGELEVEGAIAYRRPLESDSYRLSPVAGTHKLWVQ